MEINLFDFKPIPTPDELTDRFINLITQDHDVSDDDKATLREMLEDYVLFQNNGFSSDASLKYNEMQEFLNSRKKPDESL